MGHAGLSGGGVPPRLAALGGGLLAAVWIVELWLIVRPGAWLSTVGSIGLAVYVVLAWFRAARHIRILFATVLAILLVIAGYLRDPGVLLRSLEKAQIFGAFLPSVLVLRATVENSPKLDHLRRGVTALGTLGTRNWIFYGSHVLGAILNVGALAILAPIVTSGADDAERRALASSAARGIGAAVMWSPFFVAIAFTSQLVPAARLWQIMAIGSGLALIGFVLSYAMFLREMGLRAYVSSILGLRPLVLPTAVMVGAVLWCSSALHLGGLQSVALVIPVLCVAYLLVAARDRIGATARRSFANFGRLSDELLIVTGATMLGAAIAALPWVQSIGQSVTPGLVAGPTLIAVLVVTLVGLGQLGLHPMIGASILLPVLAHGNFELAPPVLVATAVFAWGLSANVAIWTLPVAAAASNFAVPIHQVSTRRSYVYAGIYLVLGLALLAGINAWLRP